MRAMERRPSRDIPVVRDEIDLVILDMVMPRMGGREAYERIRALDSEVPVIFMTGYSAEMEQTSFVLETGVAFIQKPYGIAALGNKVREALDSHAPRPPLFESIPFAAPKQRTISFDIGENPALALRVLKKI